MANTCIEKDEEAWECLSRAKGTCDTVSGWAWVFVSAWQMHIRR